MERKMRIRAIFTVIVSLALVAACGQHQSRTHEVKPNPVAAVSTPAKAPVVSEADLPTLTLNHK